MEYDFRAIEARWQTTWRENLTYKVSEDPNKEKFYVLDMFPYPSGAGLHVGHPLGYIASDIYARFKRHQGFNVLHPMGYDSFGLPAEQYAIQTGQHPAITTENNISRYREQLDKIGFCYDWDREVRTSSPDYYKWTQWIFKEIYGSWYNIESDKAESVDTLIAKFEKNGTYNVEAAIDENWWQNLDMSEFPFFGEHFCGEFSATDWDSMNERQKQLILMHFRLTFLAESRVNWCPALGTVLANDEIKDGVSERGGHPVVQKLMKQWSMRISAYSERLLADLNTIDWSDSIKEIQRNWIGKSQGASVHFDVKDFSENIEVFTTRPDTIFGATFIVLAPEHELVNQITTEDYKKDVAEYIQAAGLKTERDRQSNVKDVSGQFTGAYAINPFNGKEIPIWIAEYVLAGYGTGAIMAVPAGDQRDWDFATHYRIPIPNIFEGADISEEACADKEAKLCNSDFLDGMTGHEAIKACIEKIEEEGIGKGKTNYRLRDAVFSRQRYWGEPFPVYYKDEIPYLLDDNKHVELPEVDQYLPTEDGDPPLARAKAEAWNISEGDRMEYNTMPGWAGSSWYFLRYMDPKNENEFCSREKSDYWKQVDFYIGGAEHATGHLLYSRFWTKLLFDLGHIGFNEPFAKMINQGMILGRSSFVYRLNYSVFTHDGKALTINEAPVKLPQFFISKSHRDSLMHGMTQGDGGTMYKKKIFDCIQSQYSDKIRGNVSDYLEITLQDITLLNISEMHSDISMVDNDVLDIEAFKNWRSEYADAEFILNDDEKYICGHEVEKMSKSKYNVETPDDLVDKYGADTLRCYEMFLGPLEQSKPWDVKGISGVHNFLRKTTRLFANGISDDEATKGERKSIHKTIKKITDDLNRDSWNTVVSALMICVNELTEQKSNKREVFEPLAVILSPYAPHLAEELWSALGHEDSVVNQSWPICNEAYLKEDDFEYPVSFNGKMRFKISLPADMGKADVEAAVMAHEKTPNYLDGGSPKKVIVVPKRIVNVVV